MAGQDGVSTPTSATQEQYELIGRLLASTAPSGWSEVSLTVSVVGPALRSTVVAHLADGSDRTPLDDEPIELDRLLFEIHRQAYVPGAGSWITARVVVFADGRITVDLEHDLEPPFDFAPASWEAELKERPRTAEATPAWLAAKLEHDDWCGVRLQLGFTPDGDLAPRPLDATTTPQGHLWLREIADRLTIAGQRVTLGADEGSDATGAPTVYAEMRVTIGEGYMSVACFTAELFWSVDVFPDQCEKQVAIDTVRTVVQVVDEVTGYRLHATGLSAYERRLLGL
ncbi:hypothetical protein [Cellulomonas soli]|uniref:Uncharacterized protein n=1 Tax=Cellulomonas soli TaxID=931535 RepID=A0A512PGM9_9CELL|nr:hypothetical protein [Cellulomonas soli]NYI58223.1 hypothetical protein [Cellulomonas soli]GEP70354.1 hypothetical protein CSO01_30690 [Cellulomonas soli]